MFHRFSISAFLAKRLFPSETLIDSLKYVFNIGLAKNTTKCIQEDIPHYLNGQQCLYCCSDGEKGHGRARKSMMMLLGDDFKKHDHNSLCIPFMLVKCYLHSSFPYHLMSRVLCTMCSKQVQLLVTYL